MCKESFQPLHMNAKSARKPARNDALKLCQIMKHIHVISVVYKHLMKHFHCPFYDMAKINNTILANIVKKALAERRSLKGNNGKKTAERDFYTDKNARPQHQ